MLELIEAHRYMFYFTRKDIDILEFEQWMYDHGELEVLLGNHYFDLISINYRDKFAREAVKTIIRNIINPGVFEEERITKLLTELITDEI
ncbi:hypothetical protein SAMN04487895_10817 [Paenibacillus sophorae]|uniref:Uncharacterized protein n=1 Tax=Paenibacillus sophorae TaxID=1333845 RepID=A0A1H8Q053_9BACL|nr:hypothetical protein [Paenibacillus sophorae]QWU15319.1 hypothetical protein KP014_26125 [Paenibacillus sophorae]SEO47622.1 hypothetical protein SAMN04487895_10817 [Paenibacillus sophorae]